MPRKKIEIKAIKNKEARQVCFSKRRPSVFKKASELHTLCGAEVAVVFVTRGGKAYSFGAPSVGSVAGRLLDAAAPPAASALGGGEGGSASGGAGGSGSGSVTQVGGGGGGGDDSSAAAAAVTLHHELNKRQMELQDQLGAQHDSTKSLQEAVDEKEGEAKKLMGWLDSKVEEITAQEDLQELNMRLWSLQLNINQRANEIFHNQHAAMNHPLPDQQFIRRRGGDVKPVVPSVPRSSQG
ncbi:hypothetical protein GUJ93_ZPchr0006g45905 [Zizania palustris]|uniref:MADS-box domain-containing protein n=1 Tax=Zizania palustris TaxID=103762 RepID=A0A8J5VQ02_ZIZPA|nr:hypothetical protein GUJ93_ZPchr0006g45905 [Zizania palustris]